MTLLADPSDTTGHLLSLCWDGGLHDLSPGCISAKKLSLTVNICYILKYSIFLSSRGASNNVGFPSGVFFNPKYAVKSFSLSTINHMYCYIWNHLLHQLYQFPSYCVHEGVSLTIVSFKNVFAIQPAVKDMPYLMVIRCMGIRTENNEVLQTVTATHRTAYNILDVVSSPASWSHCLFC